jgi:hypothetical protein
MSTGRRLVTAARYVFEVRLGVFEKSFQAAAQVIKAELAIGRAEQAIFRAFTPAHL